MLDAHVTSMVLLAAPFKESTIQPVSFGPGTAWAEATNEIRGLIPIMLKHRLTPPPKETYSLNRYVYKIFSSAGSCLIIGQKIKWSVLARFEAGCQG